MILPDLNLLLYAYNSHTKQHEKARVWWESALNGRELIGLPHEVTLGFIRIATNPRLGAASISLEVARATVSTWMKMPVARVILPLENHTNSVVQLLEQSHSSGQLTSDASLAVYAIENRATLYSNDADFARFPGLNWKNPLLSD
ncbi:MAG: TA system VapC family ribonuclease toxin [Verrucomicrobiota bacterium]